VHEATTSGRGIARICECGCARTACAPLHEMIHYVAGPGKTRAERSTSALSGDSGVTRSSESSSRWPGARAFTPRGAKWLRSALTDEGGRDASAGGRGAHACSCRGAGGSSVDCDGFPYADEGSRPSSLKQHSQQALIQSPTIDICLTASYQLQVCHLRRFHEGGRRTDGCDFWRA